MIKRFSTVKQTFPLFTMQFTRRSRCLSSSSIKIILLISILFLIIINTQFFNKKDYWCDPAKPLWWFCPWPGPEAVCTWDQHFPTINGKNQYIFFSLNQTKYFRK